jgi:Zn-dependent protease with chaperone function
MNISGTFHFPGSARAHAVSVEVGFDEFRLVTEGGTYLRDDIANISPRLGTAPREIRFQDGGLLVCDDSPELNKILKTYANSKSQHVVDKFERSYTGVFALLGLATVVLVVLYFYGIPKASKWIAFQLPSHTMASAGDQLMAILDERLLEDSELESEVKLEIENRFVRLLDNIELDIEPRLHFRGGGEIGANALAVPNGDIIITDEFIELADFNLDAIEGVLAHEIGHLKHRHSMRQAITLTIVPIIITLMSGDLVNSSQVAASLPVVILEQGYSRDFEREADIFAKNTLTGMNLSTAPVADLFAKIDQEHGDSLPGFLSTHPGHKERVKFFRNP